MSDIGGPYCIHLDVYWVDTMKIPIPLVNICRRLDDAGFEAYLVGGAVRDHIIGRVPKDYDVATNARPEQVVDLFDKVILTGIKFGTVTVHLEGMEVEVTTYRRDGQYSDGRRPDGVVFTDAIEEDLARRDLTINAMALDPVGDNPVLDPFGGCIDAMSWTIRAVGDPKERFDEDGLRPMRAIRFASQLNFGIHEDTFKAICRSYDVFSRVSMERVKDELFKILASHHPEVGIKLLVESGLMNYIAPAFMRTVGCVQNRHHTQDVYGHSLSVMCALDPDPVLRFAGLFHDIGKPDAAVPSKSRPGEFHFYHHEKVGALYVEGITKRLKFSANDVNRVTHLVRYHMRLMDPPKSDAGLRRMIKKLGAENMGDFLHLRAADISDSSNEEAMLAEFQKTLTRTDDMLEQGHPLEMRELAISGDDVMKHLKIGPGPMVGKVLSYLMDQVLDEPVFNTKERLLELVDDFSNNEG
jgi:tRNA nucleotidyltransferase/poly(A) polymerase